MAISKSIPYLLSIFLIAVLFFVIYSSSHQSPSFPTVTPPTPTPRAQTLSFHLGSYRRVYFSSQADMLITTVTIIASPLCDGLASQCQFQRSQFSLDTGSEKIPNGSAPMRFIPNFQIRQLVASRVLSKNQSETGQLYFVIPKSANQASLYYQDFLISASSIPPAAETYHIIN